MGTDEMGEPGHAPRLVQRRRRRDAVADASHDDAGEVGEPGGHVAVAPAAEIGERRGQVPVVEGQVRLQAALEHGVDQPVIEAESLGVHLAAAGGHDTRPGNREPVGIEAAILQQVEILLIAVVVVAGDGAVGRADHVARRRGEAVPVRGAAAAERRPLHLVGGRRGAELELVGEVGAPEVHGSAAFRVGIAEGRPANGVADALSQADPRSHVLSRWPPLCDRAGPIANRTSPRKT
jgi:hypothetical protein